MHILELAATFKQEGAASMSEYVLDLMLIGMTLLCLISIGVVGHSLLGDQS